MNYNKIINIINNCIYYIIKYGYSYNIRDIFNKDIKDKDLEYLLNYYLFNIKKITYTSHNNIYKHFLNNNNKLVTNEIDTLFNDLFDKILNKNKRILTLPINIIYLKEYAISSMINNKYINTIIKCLIIKFAIINYINLELKI